MTEVHNDACALAWLLGVALMVYLLIRFSQVVSKWLLTIHHAQVRSTDRCKPLSKVLAPVIRQGPVRKPDLVKLFTLED